MVIEHILLVQIDIDGVDECQHITHDGDEHGDMGIVVGHDGAGGGGEDHTARDGGHEERAADLGVPTQTTQTQGEDGGETGGLEEQNHDQQADGGVAVRGGGGDGEDEAEGQVDTEHVARLEGGDHEEEACQETVEGVQALSDGKHVGAEG